MSFLSQLSWRYATKHFDSTKKVFPEDLAQILEAIKMSPSSFGIQDYKILVITNPALKASLQSASYDQPQVTQSSHVLVFCSRTDLEDRVEEYVRIATGGDTEKAQ